MDVATTRDDVVRTCYRLLLGREPDPAGFQGWTTLPGDRFSLEAVMAGIVGSEEFAQRHIAAPVVPPAPSPPPDTLVSDRARHGEVRLLLREIVNRTARHRIVVDVGAHGIEGSNSYDLLRHFGWRGLLAEMDPARCEAIRRDFAGLDFDLVQVAVADHAGGATPSPAPTDDAAAFAAETGSASDTPRDELPIKVETLSGLLDARGVPRDFDVLSIDAGGEEVRILNEAVAAGWHPRWVFIEASRDYAVSSLDQVAVTDLVRSLYAIAARTPANLLLARTGD